MYYVREVSEKDTVKYTQKQGVEKINCENTRRRRKNRGSAMKARATSLQAESTVTVREQPRDATSTRRKDKYD